MINNQEYIYINIEYLYRNKFRLIQLLCAKIDIVV